MKKQIVAGIFCCLLWAVPVSAEFVGPVQQTVTVQDYDGNEIQVYLKDEKVYVTARESTIYNMPDENGEALHTVVLGTMLTCTGECENGWKQVTYQINGENVVTGYLAGNGLSEKYPMDKCNETYMAFTDSDVLDYPGMKDGEVIGEILEMDEVQCTATINDVWSRIVFEDAEGKKQTGYVPLEVFQKEDAGRTREIDETVEAGTISETDGEGVFAEAVAGVDEVLEGQEAADPGVQVGKPLSASSEARLTSLGTFVITHYCPCSLCCGPWADGITSTGITAVTNRTIAVDPTIIPYGSKIVINGQVYVAEDCGGAIKGKRIDIYVGSHTEGNNKGKYATEVFLLEQ